MKTKDQKIDFVTFDNGNELIYYPNNKTAHQITGLYFGVKKLCFVLPYSLVDRFEMFAAQKTVVCFERR